MRAGGLATQAGPPWDPATAACLRNFEDHLRFVLRALRRQGVSATDAEDLAQDVFLVMCRRWRSYDPGRPLRAWLGGIVVKVAHRHRQRRARPAAPSMDLPDPPTPAEERLDVFRQWTLLWQAIDRLPETHRELLVLHHLEDVPVTEIAAAQAVPLFTAYTRLRAARMRLAREVAALDTTRARVTLPLLELLAASPTAVTDPTPEAITRVREAARAHAAGSTSGASRASPMAERWAWPLAGMTVGFLALLAVFWAPALPTATSGQSRTDQALAPLAEPRAHAARPPASGPVRPLPPPAFLASPAPDQPPEPGAQQLIGHWTFDDSAASALVRDRSPWGNDCHLRRRSRAATVPRPPASEAGTLQLDGRTWLECPVLDPLATIDNELTMAVWIKPAPAANDRRQVLITRQLGASGDRIFSLRLKNGELEFLSHIWARLIRRPFPASPSGWHHVAAIRDLHGTRLYLDGVELGRNHRTRPLALAGANTPLVIGAQLNGPERDAHVLDGFQGALDDLRLYTRALSSAEIQTLSRERPMAPGPRTEPRPTSWTASAILSTGP
jgi:RNA polymerase sigma-70 factor, ECF subfamily